MQVSSEGIDSHYSGALLDKQRMPMASVTPLQKAEKFAPVHIGHPHTQEYTINN
jgi:hypothetical protein